MTKFVEYRTALPFTTEQYEIASRYTSAKMKLEETGDNKGYETIHNYEPYEQPNLGLGIADYQILHISDQLPTVLRSLLPRGAEELRITNFIKYPRARTEITNPSYMKENFHILIDAICETGNAAAENPLMLPDDKLTQRRVIKIDLIDPYLSTEDLALTPKLADLPLQARDNVPLTSNWQNSEANQIIVCQFFEIEFKWWGLQDSAEARIEKAMYRIFAIYFRRMYAWMDQWHNMTLTDVANYENEVKDKLNQKRLSSEFTGLKFY